MLREIRVEEMIDQHSERSIHLAEREDGHWDVYLYEHYIHAFHDGDDKEHRCTLYSAFHAFEFLHLAIVQGYDAKGWTYEDVMGLTLGKGWTYGEWQNMKEDR